MGRIAPSVRPTAGSRPIHGPHPPGGSVDNTTYSGPVWSTHGSYGRGRPLRHRFVNGFGPVCMRTSLDPARRDRRVVEIFQEGPMLMEGRLPAAFRPRVGTDLAARLCCAHQL